MPDVMPEDKLPPGEWMSRLRANDWIWLVKEHREAAEAMASDTQVQACIARLLFK